MRPGTSISAINRFLDDHNAHSKPFQWVADPDKIIAAVRRGHQGVRLDPLATLRGTKHRGRTGSVWFVQGTGRARHVSETQSVVFRTPTGNDCFCDPRSRHFPLAYLLH
jgi:hypothetical protein